MGLNPTKHLGKTIADMQPSLLHLKEYDKAFFYSLFFVIHHFILL